MGIFPKASFALGLFWNEKVSFCRELLAVLTSRLGNQRNEVLHPMNVKGCSKDQVSIMFLWGLKVLCNFKSKGVQQNYKSNLWVRNQRVGTL